MAVPLSRAVRRRRGVAAAIGLLAVLAIYAAVVWSIGASVQEPVEPPDPPDQGLSLMLLGTTMDPAEPAVDVVVLMVADEDLVDDQGRLTQPVVVTLEPSLGADLVYREGRRPTAHELRLPLAGDPQNYPFDEYGAVVEVEARVGAADGPLAESIPLVVTSGLRDPGWVSTGVSRPQGDAVVHVMVVERAHATQVISLMLLGFMVALAVVASLVALWALLGLIEVQVGIAAWLAALLFALIPLRTFLPGAPSIGAWIDVLVFFWVEIAVMLSMLVVVVVLLVSSRRSARATGSEPDEPEPVMPA